MFTEQEICRNCISPVIWLPQNITLPCGIIFKKNLQSAGIQQATKGQWGDTKCSSESLKEDGHSERVDGRVVLKTNSKGTSYMNLEWSPLAQFLSTGFINIGKFLDNSLIISCFLKRVQLIKILQNLNNSIWLRSCYNWYKTPFFVIW
jgi:hypothetical protein